LTSVAALNNSGLPILQGQVVYQTGFSNPQLVPTIALASATTISTSVVFGIADNNILDGSIGSVTIADDFSPIDTSSFLVNDVVYLSDTLGGISTVPGTVESIIGRASIIDVLGCIYIRCKPPTCSTSGSAGADGATGIQGNTGIQGATGVSGTITGAANTLNMNALGNLSLAGTLPAVNLGPELVGGAATFVDFRARRAVPGSSGTTTIQLEVNGAPIGGATLSWLSTDPAFSLQSTVIAVPVVAGDRISFRLTSREGGSPRDIYAEVNA